MSKVEAIGPENLTFRPARADEVGMLSELAFRSKAIWGYDESFMNACRAELTLTVDYLDGNLTFVAEIHTKIAAFYSLEPANPEGTGKVELGLFFLEPELIGHGFGRTMMRNAIERARRFGFLAIRIQSDPNAESFYRAVGCVPSGSTPSSIIPGRVLPVLEYDLTSGEMRAD